ncbi:hypothetical protein [Spirosoma spitsbergense]|jgi:hypothetical protein|uniref:hypothetical protein n=1 Tax=Spirosoma spitsbergense TaxID=431554 RepID=UPI000374E906|nr:hypothetical protein [Spirosoma spitsbergense]
MPDTDLNAEPSLQISYTEDGRSGTIHYASPETTFDMWYELAIPPAVADIGIPEPRYWEARTKTSLPQREAILRLIGQQVINDKLAGDGYYLFNDQTMTVYSGKKPDTA